MGKHLSPETWIFLVLTLLSAGVLFKSVDLRPQVSQNFFFSKNDPQFKKEKLITRSFKRKDNVLIVNAIGAINTPSYLQNITNLSRALSNIHGVTSIKSLSDGPANLQDALHSPLWRRLLVPADRKSTNVIVILQNAPSALPVIEHIVQKSSAPDFRLIMSGPPYITELIGRHLLKDLRVFTLLALLIFGLVIWFIFRSRGILLGAMISCMGASVWSLLLTHLLGIRIGLLTANLATIVFVLTLSHIVFLTYNWKYACSQKPDATATNEAVHLTISPSFWSLLTVMLGFLSLLLVPAQPLKELGSAGMAGALVAFSTAYGVYPAFLRLVPPGRAQNNSLDRYQKKMEVLLEKKKRLIILAITVLCVAAGPGLWRANTDPNLLSYFKKNSEIEKNLAYIDHHGGSNPLVIVVKMADGEKLTTAAAYQHLWQLQRALEKDPAVGTVISLPVLMAQAKQSFLASLLSWNWLLDILKGPEFNGIAKSFITNDHKEGLFLLRMNESNRHLSRLKIIDRIKTIVTRSGLVPEIVGGSYSLQAHLGHLVASSVIFGLGQLIFIFALIAWAASRSLRVAAAIILSICVIPVIVLGTMGWMRVPLDIISAPASNIAIGLGIDSMLHMVKAWRRQKLHGQKNQDDEKAWQSVRHRFWQPVGTFTLIIVLGFGIFMFSDFPSTQRFGAAVVFGAFIACLTALFVMPATAQKHKRIIKKNQNNA